MYIDYQEILNATNGGLDIILHYYPQAKTTLESNKREFKIRPERTPSARIKKLKDGNWIVTDFGEDQTSRNGIQVCQKEENITYREAIVMLAGRYDVGGISREIHKADFKKRKAKPAEKEGEYYYKVKKKLSENELQELGPNITQKLCDKYNVFSLNSFIQVKDRMALVTSSTDDYPIYIFEHKEFKKIYQPRNPDKQYRFRYVGSKPKDFINGLIQVKKAYEEINKDIDPEDLINEASQSIVKLPEVILCSGDRDALNVASFGYQVIWLNSETATLKNTQYREIKKYCNELFNLPDIDNTGIRQAINLGLQYLDIKTIWLPDKLKSFKDPRGNPRKDFRDYVEIYPSQWDFSNLVKIAIPLQFWDIENTDKGTRYHFNNVHAYYFLKSNGFYLLEDKNNKDGFIMIRIENNIVSQVEVKHVKDFINQFLEKRYLSTGLRNMMLRTNQLTEPSLANLPKIDIDFKDYDKQTQFLFFKNKTWKVTAKGVEEFRPAEISKSVWEEEVIQHKVRRLKAPFKISYNNEENEYDIEVNNSDSLFFKYLINSSRVHWRQELENRLDTHEDEYREKYRKENEFKIDGDLLEEAERWEQKQHLINKIFSIGYLLHRYKDPSRPWCVFAMDNKISDMGESHGRTGKSLCYKTMKFFMKTIILPGRNPNLTNNPHIYDRVTKHTDNVLIDDADQYLKFNFFFEATTGDLTVNPKGTSSYEIPYEDVPKFVITSNYTLRNIDPSTEGRILYSVFSDYYHLQTDEADYREKRQPNDQFGKNLFFDYTEEEWNLDFNFFAECLKFFLSVPSPGKIDPPMENVTRRNLRTTMTDGFKNWADVYFSPEGDHLDNLIPKTEAFEDYGSMTKSKFSMNRFTKSLKAWCRYNKYILDPEGFYNSQGRIIKFHNNKATEMIYIQTRDEIDIGEFLKDGAPDVPDDKKPF